MKTKISRFDTQQVHEGHREYSVKKTLVNVPFPVVKKGETAKTFYQSNNVNINDRLTYVIKQFVKFIEGQTRLPLGVCKI